MVRATRRWVIGASVLAAAVLAAPLLGRSFSGGNFDLGSPAGADAAAVTTNITVNPAIVGSPLRAGFVGFSLPPNGLAANDFAGTSLVGYLKLLGPSGVIRIGGNSGDTTFWTSTGQAAPSWATGVITPASLRTLASVVRASGWGVILPVNLKHFDPARAGDEARFAQRILGSSLVGIEIGNEPPFYYSSTAAYLEDFNAYATAIRLEAPGVSLLGPNSDPDHPDFLTAFTAGHPGQPGIAAVTSHLYPTSACNGSVVTISELLGTATRQYETASAQALVSAADHLQVPAVVDETNSAVCGGAPGVSNVFASALWGLDNGLRLAQAGVAGAYFEGGIAGCVTYSPLCRSGTGSLTAQPLYYGMLAISAVGTGNFVSVTNPDSANIEAYAVRNGKDLTVVLDDLQDPSVTGPSTVRLNLGAPLRLGQMTVLATSSRAGLAATTGITLGGQQVGAAGNFQSPALTPAAVTGQSTVVSIDPGSAVIIRFTGNAALPVTTAKPTPTAQPMHTVQPTPSPPGSPSGSSAPVTSTPRTAPSAPITTAAPPPAGSVAASGASGSLESYFAPAFSGASFCQFSHQNVSNSNGVLTTMYPAGSSSPKAGPPFGGAQICIPSSQGQQSTLSLTYSVRFPVGFQFVKGGKLPGIYGGTEPFSGGHHNPNGWSMRLMWRTGGAGEVYSYTAHSTGFGEDYGLGNFSWQADGNWHTVTERVTINSPGASNGSVTLTYDGKQVIDQTGIDITDTNTLPTGLFFSTFYGGHDSSWAPSADESISFKNFSVSG